MTPTLKSSLDRTWARVDQWQQMHRGVSFVVGVLKKFSDDEGGSLVALIAYYSFLSVFPLLMILVTVAGIIAGGSPSFEHRIVNSALSQFPVVGAQLGKSIEALHRRNIAAIGIGIVGVVWGSLGASRAGQRAMADVWDVPRDERPGFGARIARDALFVLSIGVFVVASSALAGFASFDGLQGIALRALGSLGSLTLNCLVFVIAFRVLTPKQIDTSKLIIGAIVGAASFTALQVVGGYLIGHELRRASQLYGFFAIVLGMISWIYLVSRITVVAAEVNVVKERGLWPRSLRPERPTSADDRAYAYLAREQRRSTGERVEVHFEESTSVTFTAGEGDAE